MNGMADFSGTKIVANAGIPEALGSGDVLGALYLKALETNTGVIKVGDANTASQGYRLSAGQEVLLEYVNALDDISIDVTVGGEGVCWLRANRAR